MNMSLIAPIAVATVVLGGGASLAPRAWNAGAGNAAEGKFDRWCREGNGDYSVAEVFSDPFIVNEDISVDD